MMDNDKMDGLSMDIEAAEQHKLRALFPQCFVDSKLSVTKNISPNKIPKTSDTEIGDENEAKTIMEDNRFILGRSKTFCTKKES